MQYNLYLETFSKEIIRFISSKCDIFLFFFKHKNIFNLEKIDQFYFILFLNIFFS